MKKIVVMLVVVAISLVCVGVSNAKTATIGQISLKGTQLVLSESAVTSKGNASLNAPTAVITADTIQVDLTKNTAFSKGTATGNVKIHARQVDSAGNPRVIDATAQTATMVAGQNTVVLSGSVVSTITDPQISDQPMRVVGERVTIYLKERTVVVDSLPGKESELVITPKEK